MQPVLTQLLHRSQTVELNSAVHGREESTDPDDVRKTAEAKYGAPGPKFEDEEEEIVENEKVDEEKGDLIIKVRFAQLFAPSSMHSSSC